MTKDSFFVLKDNQGTRPRTTSLVRTQKGKQVILLMWCKLMRRKNV